MNCIFGFPLDYLWEMNIISINPVGNQVLDTQVAQRYGIGDGIFTEPHTVVLAVHR